MSNSGSRSFSAIGVGFAMWLAASHASFGQAVSTPADESESTGAPLEGHSAHGEVFNEGPRQSAVLIPGTGAVNLPVTTTSADGQRFFDQGVGQLHGFWYFEAERSFRQVLLLDPECAMAYWGLTMANFSNKERATDFIAEAKALRDGVSKREQMWIDSLVKYFEKPDADEKGRRRELVRNLEAIVDAHPEELEAKAFLLYQIYSNSKERNGYVIPSNLAIDLLAKTILEQQPAHPCHHYRIHLWDAEKPAKALDSAAQCGPAAPGVAHMWHMPGHIYSKLHRYADAAWQQEASARVDHAHQMRYHLIPDQIHNFAHNNEWLIRNLNHIGRCGDAVDLAKNMIELPRRPKFSADGKTWTHGGTSWNYGRLRLRDTLLNFEQWPSLLALSETDYLKPDVGDVDEEEWHRLVGLAAFMSGDAERGGKQLESLSGALAEKTAARDKAVAAAEKKNSEAKKSDKEIEKAKKNATANFDKAITDLGDLVNELTVYSQLYPAADEPAQADQDAALELLPKLKTVGKSRLAQLYLRAGDSEAAIKKIAEEVAASPGQVLPVAHQVDILFASEKTDEAFTAFAKLRELAVDADLELPVFQRVSAHLKASPADAPQLADVDLDDWRAEAVPADDLGERPDLDTLGPFRWAPQQAADWTLNDGDGKPVSMADYRGKPVLVIFYLGNGCIHCMEQLQAFSPLTQKFKAAGIPIVAIGTDSEAGLRETYALTNDGEKDPFAFPLLSNESMDAFKACRAYDDFEDMALHGTFLIDGQGRVRWQDISYQPFMNAEWLLEECQRLLALDEAS